jgi:proline dehydrogenase
MSSEAPKLNFNDTSIAFSSKTNWELRKAKWIFLSFNYDFLVKTGSNFMLKALKIKLPLKGIIKNTVFAQFCGGENINDSVKSINHLSEFNIGSILDYSVEGEKSEKGFDKGAEEIIKTIKKAAEHDSIPFSVFKASGIASVGLLEKIQAKSPLNEKEKESQKRLLARFEKICQNAYDHQIPLMIDAEETWIQLEIDRIVLEMMRKFNRDRCIIFITYQMYLKRSLDSLKALESTARSEGFFAGAKLVRGAYMGKESSRAKKRGYEDPINPSKDASDKMYNDGLKFCVEKKDILSLVAGTHNEESSLLLAHLMDENGIKHDDKRFWFAQLYGMSDHISFNLSNAGYNVAKYLPYGPVEKVMPYLVRRAQENKSVSGQIGRELSLIVSEIKRRKQKA